MRYEKIVLLAFVLFFGGCAKNKIEHANGKTLLIYPAIEGKMGDKKCVDFFGRCLVFQTETPVVQLNDFSFQALPKRNPEGHNEIAIGINENQSLES